MKNKNFAIFTILLLIFLVRAFLFLDPDFGWHLRNGQLFISQGIFKTDPYSFTMPSFAVVSHEWSIDILWHFLYSRLGQWGISILWSLLPIATLYLLAKNHKRGIAIATLLAAGSFLPFFGNRPQVIGWLFFATVLHILLYSKRQLPQIFLPIIFLLWANIHGSFAAGIISVWIIVLARLLHKKLQRNELLVGILCSLITFMNPFGMHIWEEIWSSISDHTLRWRIGEWEPAIFNFHPPLLLLLVLTIMLLLRYRQRFRLEEFFLFLFFLFQSAASRRHVPLLVIIALPIVLLGFRFLEIEIRNKKLAYQRFNFALRGLLIFVIIICSVFGIITMSDTITKSYYPSDAVLYLKQNQTQGNIFSHYNWGGYFIWKLPEKKVFVDGRMPSWRRSELIANESQSAMDEYEDILSGKFHFKTVFKKYNIDTVVWLKGSKHGVLLISDLKKFGWKKAYEDSVAEIYQAPSVIQSD